MLPLFSSKKESKFLNTSDRLSLFLQSSDKEFFSTSVQGYADVLDFNKKCRLIITSNINSRVIPFIDCDSPKAKFLACQTCFNRRIKYAVFESSEQKYWVIPDLAFLNVSDAISFIELNIKGCDEKYLSFVKQHRFFSIRGEMKGSFKPRLIKNECTNIDVNLFVGNLENHFTDNEVLLLQLNKMRNDEIDSLY